MGLAIVPGIASIDPAALSRSAVTLSMAGRTMNLNTDTIRCRELDFGWPDIRVVDDTRTDADGTTDTTQFHGARAVTATLRLSGSTRMADLDALRFFCHPGRRPTMTVTAPSMWAEARRIVLRAGQQSAPLKGSDGASLPVQVGWVAPDGILESALESTVTVLPSGQSSTGLTYPVTYPVTYAATLSGGPVMVTNAGSAPVDHITRMYGPATGPVLSLDGVGSLSFPGLVIPAGDYVEVNSRERTVLANGLASVSRYGFLDFATTTWWRLQPGANLVRYSPGSYSAGAAALVTFRSGWL